MAEPIVTRTLGIDFIYFDLLFLGIWILFLIRKGYWFPIIWGIIGWGMYLIVDYYIWYIVLTSRTYSGPINPHLFFMWFTFSPGFTQFSYCFIMLEKRNFHDMLIFTLVFFLGWILVGVLSQLVPLQDTIVEVSRNMGAGNQRLIMSLVAIGNILLAFILRWMKQLRWEDVLYIFIVGTLVELNLELSLLVSGIRLEQGTWSFTLMLVNTLVEFNVGIVPMWLIMRGFLKLRDRRLFPPLTYVHFRYIQSDYNRVMLFNHINESSLLRQKLIRIYGEPRVTHDIDYISSLS